MTGESGSGKTVLAHTLMGRHFYTGQMDEPDETGVGGPGKPRIAMVEQQHKFRSQAGTTELYYQQRFNASDADKTITVAQELAEYAGWKGNGASAANEGLPKERESWLDSLHIRPLLNKPLIQLSNGENKRVQLAIALLESPECLILDNPFLGLDIEGRATLHTIVNRLAAEGMQILLITSSRVIPDCITHIGQLEKGRWSFCGPKTSFHHSMPPNTTTHLNTAILARLRQAAQDDTTAGDDFSVAVKMVDTTIKYGEAIILNHINWEVRKGERWSVSGPNGAGKSTLLSLITADNPQAYANDIWLFDRRRGTGETIWDIKRKIGFVSPELHLYFDTGVNCFEVIASGLFDTIGLFRPLTTQQEETTLLWMQLLSLQELRTRRLAQLSTGQQRMVLLARALIKNPPMLILDEPSQGLDEEQTAYFKSLVAILCEAFDKTLIYVSHYRQELPSCIDRFLQLEKGGLVP